MKVFLLVALLSFPILVTAETLRTTIGVVAPLTGSAASNGMTIKNSIELAQQHFDPQHTIQFIFEDDQLTPKNTVNAVHKLISINKVQGLIIFGSSTSLAVNAIAERHRVPMIALSIVDRVVDGFSFIVKLWVSARVENQLLVQEIQRRGYQRIAVATSTNDAMLLLKQLATDSLQEKIVTSEDVAREESDLRATALRLLSKSPDAIYNLTWAPQVSLLARALRGQGFTGPIFGVHNLDDPNEVMNATGTLDGAWLVTGDDSAAADYLSRYTAQFGSPPTAGGANAYDAAKLFIEGSRQKDLNQFLHTVKDFRGALGTYSASGRNDFTIGARLKHIRSGKLSVDK